MAMDTEAKRREVVEWSVRSFPSYPVSVLSVISIPLLLFQLTLYADPHLL